MTRTLLIITFCLLLFQGTALAHFGMVIPESSLVTADKREININISFSHPFEGKGMDMKRPAFHVYHDGKATDLTKGLAASEIMGAEGWQVSYRPARPGVYQFVAEPVPYWEPAEDCFIIHYTKTIVAAFGIEEGWDKALGIETEIVPFTRPFGFYKGYTFTGQVMRKGKPVPFAEVEVEFYNRDGIYHAPEGIFTTYVLKADKEGMFSFSCPLAGWWGFSALTTADYKIKGPDGLEKPVETGAVLWIQVSDWQKK